MGYYELCPLCGHEAHFNNIPDGKSINCKACGNFTITGSMAATLDNLDSRVKQKIGFWTRDQNDLGESSPVVDTYAVEFVEKLPDRTVMERAERLLRYGIKEQKDLGGVFSLTDVGLIGHTNSRSINDVRALAELLCQNGWLYDNYRMGLPAQVTPQGFMHATEANISESVNGFIAMWFDKSMDSARAEGLEPAIRKAGYTPVIVSGVEHINKIDDEIISQIRKSKFLVADFTGHRGGVYFEAGFAMGLGLPVFWTCQKDHLSGLHFDIRQYNCIDWTDTDDLAVRLRRRIEAVIGVGPIAR
jgi:hypothetical protein